MVSYRMERCDLMNSPEVEKMNELLSSCSKVTARLIESIVQTNQLASQSTPEMQELFHKWLNLLSGELLNHVQKNEPLDVEGIANRIGVTPSTVLSLLLFLHRKGEVAIKSVTLEKADGRNREICHCLTD